MSRPKKKSVLQRAVKYGSDNAPGFLRWLEDRPVKLEVIVLTELRDAWLRGYQAARRDTRKIHETDQAN